MLEKWESAFIRFYWEFQELKKAWFEVEAIQADLIQVLMKNKQAKTSMQSL